MRGMKTQILGIIAGIIILPLVFIFTSCKANSATQTNQQPVEVVSVQGPLEPINPGGPNVEITLENTSSKPITSINATLKLNRDFMFEFDVSPSKSLLPGKSISSRLILIGGGFSTDTSYPLQIEGTFEGGVTFNFIKQVQITEP
jgi:hypothetical protein